MIPQGNLCMESFSNVQEGAYAHVCNLLSLNLANIDVTGLELQNMTHLGVKILEAALTLTDPPTDRGGNGRHPVVKFLTLF